MRTVTDDSGVRRPEIDTAPLDGVEATIIVPTHRGVARLPPLLEALAAQRTEARWEVLFAVDGVLDETPELLRSWSDRLPLRTITSVSPRGVVGAMNSAIGAARGRVVIRCDDDLTPGPDFISRHLRHHPDGARRGVVGPTRDVWPQGSTYAEVYGREASDLHVKTLPARDAEFLWLAWAANNSALREDLLAVGGFDPRFVYGEDSELGYRLMRSGVEIFIDPALTIDHRGPAQSLASRVPRAFVAGASRRLFLLVHPEGRYPVSNPRNLRDRVWPMLVSVVILAARSHGAYRRLGAIGEWLMEHLPAKAGRRVAALLIEAAGIAGRRYGSVRLADYSGQKTVELLAEGALHSGARSSGSQRGRIRTRWRKGREE